VRLLRREANESTAGYCAPHPSKHRLEATICISFAVQPEDCFLNNSRVLTIATAFGFAIFVTVYLSASFSGAVAYWSLAALWPLAEGQRLASDLPRCQAG
jgi:hypothetical protein